MQRLCTILEAGHCNRDIGAVRTHVDAFSADVVAFQAALAFLLDEGIEGVLLDKIHYYGTLALGDFVGVGVQPEFLAMVALQVLALQNLICGSPGITDGRDDGRRSMLHIANQKDVLTRSLTGCPVDGWPTVLSQRNAHCLERITIGLLANRRDQGIHLQCNGPVCRQWTAAAFSVRRAKFHHATSDRAVGIESLRIGQEVKLHAVLNRLFVLFTVSRNLVEATAIDDGYVLHTRNAQRGAGAVHGGVAGTNDSHMTPQGEFFTAVETAQKRQRLVEVAIVAIQLDATVFVSTDADQYIFKPLSFEFVNGELRIAAIDKFHTMVSDEVDVMLYQFARTAKAWNDVAWHATRRLLTIKQRHRVACTRQEIPGGQASRAHTDDRHRVTRPGTRRFVPTAAVFVPALFQSDFFQIADIERAFVIESRAVGLTLVIANVAGDRRQRIGAVDDIQRVSVAPLAD